MQADLFDARGRQLKGWTNKLIWGDNKLILSSLKNGPLREEIERQGGLKLIYIDPPFDVGADFSMDIEIGGDTFTKQPNILEEIAYRDTWGKGADSFIAMIYERLILMRDLLAEDGSIYVHCDWRVNAFLRVALSEVFGSARFQSEIIWKRKDSNKTGTNLPVVTDSVFFYSKAEKPIWNQIFLDTQKTESRKLIPTLMMGDADLPSPTFDFGSRRQKRPRAEYEWKGIRPRSGRHWAYPLERMLELERRKNFLEFKWCTQAQNVFRRG